MPRPRYEKLDLSVTRYYHCMTRCVRQAYLCGEDALTGQSYEHRRDWVQDRLLYLASLFSIGVCAYAVLSNHLHHVLHVDKERAEAWCAGEVVRRYTEVYPSATKQWEAAQSLEAKLELVEKWRSRLYDISWFNRALNEFIARKANKEDKVKGHFWEGRFESQPILDEQGLLASMIYVDLNPVRAGLATSLEDSDFTSIQERLLSASRKGDQENDESPTRLVPFQDQAQSGVRVPMNFRDYVELVEWTGRSLVPNKRGRLSGPVPAILRRGGISSSGWLQAMSRSGLTSVSALGRPESLEQRARGSGKKWLRGIGLARSLAA